MSSISVKHALLLTTCLLLAACTAGTPTGTPAAAALPTVSPVTPSALPSASATPGSAVTTLRIWLPPAFAPDTHTPGGSVLAEQLAQFEQAHPNIKVEVRLKAALGPGGLLHSLSTAYNVAPSILPDIIALNQDDLAAAVPTSLIVPLDQFFPADTFAAYYPGAQALSRADGNVPVGLPFAADARVLVYDTATYPAPPLTWDKIFTGTFVFPGAELSGLTVLNEYLALGGTLTDASGQPALDVALLSQTLAAFQKAQNDGVLSFSTLTYDSPAATWKAFRERRATLAVTSAQWYLAEHDLVSTSAATLLPTPEGKPLTLVTGWSWAMVNSAPERQAAAAELLAWLIDPAQLSSWTLAAQVLPTRPSALAQWNAAPNVPFASDVLTHAQLQPSAKMLALVGPPLQQALADVLRNRTAPQVAASAAVEAIVQP